MKFSSPAPVVLLVISLFFMPAIVAAERSPNQSFEKSRLVVLTDMGNEPDDQMSLVRLLVYANEFDIEAVVATTSIWLRNKTNPQTIHKLIDAYGEVRPNLHKHAQGWPEAQELHARVSSGHAGYGLAAIESAPLSEGAKAIIAAADRKDERPLWISVWGGANTLAEALKHVQETRSAEQLAKFVSKLRVYSISDQDDAGPWVRREFPKLFYIVKPSTPNSEEYRSATWTGISGDHFYRNGQGADDTTVTNEWLEANIRQHGPLGKLYPHFEFIMEGDTPAFLGLINNGLNSHIDPSWGGWGGRYIYRRPYGETHPIWTQGGDTFSRLTSEDEVIGIDGQTYTSDQATIWRWRTQFQHDFAARMAWTVKSFEDANHNPTVIVNGDTSTNPIRVELVAGEKLKLDASASHDVDGDKLHHHWFVYREAGAGPGAQISELNLNKKQSVAGQSKISVDIKSMCREIWMKRDVRCPKGQTHIILAVTDDGKPALTSYRRIIVNTFATAEDKQRAAVMTHSYRDFADARYYVGALTLGQLMDNPQTHRVLKQHVPQLVGGDHVGQLRDQTLVAIQNYAPTMLSDELLTKIQADLNAIE